MKTYYDTIIVGAGAAGIACAERLLQAGKNILILEGRSRIGGRIHTFRESRSAVALELGAEFIHGTPDSLIEHTTQYSIPFYNVCDNHHFFDRQKLKELPDFWEGLERIMKRLPNGEKDKSVAEFIETLRSPAEDKSLFRSFVEGFHSANVNLMSARGLSDTEESDENTLNGVQMFRPLYGYRHLLQQLVKAAPRFSESLRLNTILKKINWQRKDITLECESILSGNRSVYQCRKLVITVPLGVLKAPAHSKAGIEWSPHVPEGLDVVLDSLEMGGVQKLLFSFHNRFWEKLFKNEPSFFHTTADQYFPTWWTLMPLRTPHLVAWQGGPKAQEMSQWRKTEKIQRALSTLSVLTGKSVYFLEKELVNCVSHDWVRDPFSQGAYSYVLLDGVRQAASFNKVFEDRFVFAGEATAEHSARGTVHGALESGRRAAQKVLA